MINRKNMLLEMAFPKSKYIQIIADNLRNLILNYCLVLYAERGDNIYIKRLRNHWGVELETIISALGECDMKDHIKRDPEYYTKVIKRVFDDYDASKKNNIKNTLMIKLEKEYMPHDPVDESLVDEIIEEWRNHYEEIISLIASNCKTDIYIYVEDLK